MQNLEQEGLNYAASGAMDKAIACFTEALMKTPNNPQLHNSLANAYKTQQALNHACFHYHEAIRLDEHYPHAHHNLANLYSMQGNTNEALLHYQLALKAAPDFALAHYHFGLFHLKHMNTQAAKIHFERTAELEPAHLNAHFYLGILALENAHHDEAETRFIRVLQDNPEHVDALINLGVVALKRHRGQIAIDYFTRALALDDNNADALNNLAATFMHHDRFENALTHYAVLLKQSPENTEYHYNSGVAEMSLGQLHKASEHFNAILKQDPRHFNALTNLAAIATRLKQRTQAIYLLSRAHDIKPNDASCAFMLHALKNEPCDTCPDYAKNLFDNYAIHYEKHLQETLNYTLPQHISRLIYQDIQPETLIEHTLDLGCGTGLTGKVLREFTTHLTGVDISAKMLRLAEEKHEYDRLIEQEIVAFLMQDETKYDLIVAADVLPYFGSLDNLFKAVRARIKPQAYWILSAEISPNPDWQLQETSRFCHHPSYIHALAHKNQFNVLQQQQHIARQQESLDLPVMLYLLQAK